MSSQKLTDTRIPRFCSKCGKGLQFVPTYGADAYDIYTGNQLPTSRGVYKCVDFVDDMRGEGNGHSYFRRDDTGTFWNVR